MNSNALAGSSRNWDEVNVFDQSVRIEGLTKGELKCQKLL
jgi:hypothetical protein